MHLGDRAIVAAQAGVTHNIPDGQTYLGNPAGPMAEASRQLAAFRRLPEMRDRIKKMEKDLEELRSKLVVRETVGPQSAAA